MTSLHCKSTVISLCMLILYVSNILSSVSAYHEITGVAAPLHYILHETSNNQIPSDTETIQVSSNVPLTVKRYYDDLFHPGDEPIKSNYVHVLITSGCDATTYVPTVYFSDYNTKITVDVQGVPSDNTFLQNSTSYKVEWSAPSDPYAHPQCGTTSPSRLNEGREFSLKYLLFPNDSNIKEVFQRILGRVKKEEPPKKIKQVNTELLSDPQCNVNVEILYDSCSHNMEVLSAPKVRVVDGYLNHIQHRQQISEDDVKFDNFIINNKDNNQYVEKRVKQHPGNAQHRESDDESCVTEYRAHIMYVIKPGTLAGSPLVPQVLCNRPKKGGPRYIDDMESNQ